VVLTKGSAIAPFVYTLFRRRYAGSRYFCILSRQRGSVIAGGRIICGPGGRFTCRKHDAGLRSAIAYCLAQAGVAADDLIASYSTTNRSSNSTAVGTYVALALADSALKMSVPLWLREKLFQKNLLRDG
jgi:carbamoyltransferase